MAEMERRPRIVLIAPRLRDLYLGECRPVGGTEVMTDLIARHLADHFAVTVLVDGPAPTPGRSGPLAGQQGPPGVAIATAPLLAALQGPGPLAAWRFLREVNRALVRLQPDLVYAHTTGMEIAAASWYARRHRAASVYHWGADTDRHGLVTPGPPGLAALFLWGRRHADLQVCQTDQQFLSLPAAERARAMVLPNPLNTKLPLRRSTGGHVLWVARIVPNKRPDLFLGTAQRLPTRRFVMAGEPSSPEDRANLERGLRTTPNVDWVGQADAGKLADLYAGAQCLLNTSDVEGFPNTFLEACAAGVPVVSLRCDPNGILQHQGAGRFLGGNVAGLAEAVEGLYDAARWAEAQEACLRVAREHAPGLLVPRLEAKLREVLLAKGRPVGRERAS